MGSKAHSTIIYNINNTALRSNTVPFTTPIYNQDNAEHFLRLLLTGDAKGLYEADQTPRWGHQPTCFACTEVCGELGRNPALLNTAPASDWVPCSSQGKAEPAPQNCEMGLPCATGGQLYRKITFPSKAYRVCTTARWLFSPTAPGAQT